MNLLASLTGKELNSSELAKTIGVDSKRQAVG